jgi:hypothetical protein
VASGDKFKAKVILSVVIDAYNEERAQRRWDTTLEKLKYQVTNVKITETLKPNWKLIEEEDESDSGARDD